MLLDVTGARGYLQCLLMLRDWIGVFVLFARRLPGANCGNDNTRNCCLVILMKY